MTQDRFATHLLIPFLASLASSACAVSVDEGSEKLDTSTAALMTATATWSQGQQPVNLGSASDRFCFLTSIQGKFDGAGEFVRLQISGGQWQLTGGSGQVGVAASARCQLSIAASDITAETNWVQGQAQQNLGSTNNRACFLTGVEGRFRGGGEAVWVRKSGGNYVLGGQSGQVSVGGRARCVLNKNTFINDWNWMQGNGSTAMVQAVTENNGWACGLTRMTGKFQGGGESIYIDWYGSQRTLAGTSSQIDVGASANCF